jgi:hypothetical protein
MGKLFLRMFAIDTLIDVVITLLASTVKNPNSAEAIRLRHIVAKLNKATADFLTQVNLASFKNDIDR